MSWQPIATAPKDGRAILGRHGKTAEEISIYRWDVQAYHRKPNPYWARPFHPVYYDRNQQPTEWMDLNDFVAFKDHQ